MRYAAARNTNDGPVVELARRPAPDDLAESLNPLTGEWGIPPSLEARLGREVNWDPIAEEQVPEAMRQIEEYWREP